MLISHKYKFVTIDIPKTGTRSIRESLKPLNVVDIHGVACLDAEFYQHGNAINIRKQFQKNDWVWDDYFKFIIVRNPWSRYFSFFKYFKNYGEKYLRRDKSIDWRKSEINQGKYCVDLFKDRNDQDILKNIILNHDSQDTYYRDETGEIIVDHIASFENIKNEFAFLCNHVNVDLPVLRHGNKSADILNMHDIYNDQLIETVRQKENHLIQYKKYKF